MKRASICLLIIILFIIDSSVLYAQRFNIFKDSSKTILNFKDSDRSYKYYGLNKLLKPPETIPGILNRVGSSTLNDKVIINNWILPSSQYSYLKFIPQLQNQNDSVMINRFQESMKGILGLEYQKRFRYDLGIIGSYLGFAKTLMTVVICILSLWNNIKIYIYKCEN